MSRQQTRIKRILAYFDLTLKNLSAAKVGIFEDVHRVHWAPDAKSVYATDNITQDDVQLDLDEILDACLEYYRTVYHQTERELRNDLIESYARTEEDEQYRDEEEYTLTEVCKAFILQ